ncbi:AI-2E family transporter [Patescibacteria group bacterium]|nr:AI-2E family transporter [Patescibacteria group bacterium]MBU1868510.1 AI-2E family transporter [Patescibacteria group bacterium]
MEPINLATRITFRVLSILALVGAVFVFRYHLVFAFGSWVLVTALDPLVSKLEQKKIPRGLSSFIILILTAITSVAFFNAVIPPLLNQALTLVQNLPQVISNALNTLSFWTAQNIDARISPFLEQLTENLSRVIINTPGDLIRIGQSLVTSFFAAIAFIIITSYFLIEYPRIASNFIQLFPPKQRDLIEQKITVINLRIGGWVRGQIILLLVIGISTWFGLTLLQIPFALSLGIIAGVMEIIPMIGPIISMFPALIVALAISPWKAASIIILYFLIQQIENSFVVPRVMKHTSGLDPLVVIIALFLGGHFLGISGTIVAIPAVLVAWTLLEDSFSNAQKKKGA